MSNELIFVYGTLRREASNDMARWLSTHADYVSEGTCQGRLYQVADYPGVVPSDDPSDRVRGEVYALQTPERMLPLLDHYEGYGPGFKSPMEYIRQRQEIELTSGEYCMAWVYMYNRPTQNLRMIPSGDFLTPNVGNSSNSG